MAGPRPDPDGRHEVLAGVTPGDEHPLTFDSGDLFVMSPSGRTVAAYHLDQPGQPSDAASSR